MRAQQQAVARCLPLLVGDEQRVLRVARRMVRRKIQRLEVVVVGLDLGAFADRVAHRLEDGDDLVLHAQHRMFDADRPLHARQRNVDPLGRELRARRRRMNAELRGFNRGFGARLQFVDALPDLALRFFRSGLQPCVVDLREQAILARHPAVAKRLPVGLGLQRASLGLKRSKQVSDGFIERCRRIVVEFGNGVHECVSLKYNGRPCGRPSRQY